MQSHGSISGIVTGPPPAYSISISTNLDNVVVEAITAKDTLYTTTVGGIFLLRKVPVGPVTLQFSHISHKTTTREVEVERAKTTDIYIKLQDAVQEIETVTVKGESSF